MKKRALSILLACVFLLSVFMFCTTAFAAENSADGLNAVLTTDKTDYVAGDTINVALEVTNTGNLAQNIQTELIIPEGVELVEGVLKSETAPLAGNDSVKFNYVLEVPSVEVPTTAAPTTQAPTTEPGTGDDTAPETGSFLSVIYGTLALASLAGLVALTFGSKMLKQRWFVLILCAGLLLGVVAPMAASAADADLSFEVVEAITIDGAAAEVKAIITYDLDTDEVVYKADGEVKWSHVGEKGYWTPSNITYQGVSTNEKTRVEIEAPYYAMLFGSAEGKAGKYDPATMFNADAEQKVLVGRTTDEASLKALDLIDADEWIIALVDGKIVVTGWYDAATVAAVDALAELVNVDAADVTLTLPIVGKMNYTHSNLPTMPAGTFLNGMDSEGGAVVLRYNDITKADFDAYEESLADAGYTLYQKNELANLGDVKNVSATYVNGDDVVTIIYLPYVIEDATDLPTHLADAQKRSFRPDGTEMRIILQSAAQLFPNGDDNAYEDLGITPKMHNVNLYDKYGDGNDIGQCTIYTLADGSFLVWDGGAAVDADQLYRSLKYMNERPDGKIVVAGWIFTHDHGDHTLAISELSNSQYASEITIEKVIFNKAADLESWYNLTDPLGTSYSFGWAGVYNNMENVISKFAQGEDFQVVVPHFGQILNIRNANVEILFSGEEDIFPVLLNNDNAVSLVTMVTFDDAEVDDRTLILGDHALDATYNFIFPYLSDGALKSDIVLTAHHGLGGGTSKLYPICGGPETAIWCTTWRSATGEANGLTDLFTRSQNAALRSSVKVDVMCDEYVHTLELPFNADEDEVIRTKIGTYKSKFQTAEMDISLLPAFRFEGKWNAEKDTIVAYLKEHSADVLILPLIDQNTKTVYNKADVVNQLVEALDYRYVYYAPVWNCETDGSGNLETGDGTMGHLVLSTYPVLKAETGILVEGNTNSWANPEGRGYAHLLLDVEGVEIDLVATHFNDSGNWAKFAELYQQWGKHTIIAGNTKIGGNVANAGVPLSSAAFESDVTVLGSEGISFINSSRDDGLINSSSQYYVGDISEMFKTTATFSLYVAPDAPENPEEPVLGDPAFMQWWANSWGGGSNTFETIMQNLREQNIPVVAMQQISNSILGVTPEQVAIEAGYEYCQYVKVFTFEGGKEVGHMLLSHTPIQKLDDIVISDGSDDIWFEGRVVGHAVVEIGGVETDIYYGTIDGSVAQMEKLEKIVKKFADETGRPFIVSTNDTTMLKNATVFADYAVDSYYTDFICNLLVSTGKLTVTSKESIATSVSSGGVDKMNILKFDVDPNGALTPVEPEVPDEPDMPTIELKTAVIPAFRFGPRWAQYKDLIIENLKGIDADVLAVALVDQNSERYNNTDVVTQLVNAMGYEYSYFAPVWAADDDGDLTTGEGTIGHLILSRYPILESETTILVEGNTNGWANPEGRGVGRVLLDVKGTKLDVYVTHFQDSSNWALFAENFAPKGDAFLILGNTKVAGDKDVISDILGKEDIKSAFTTDVNITGGTGVSFADSGRDTVLYETIIHESGESLVDPLYYTTVSIPGTASAPVEPTQLKTAVIPAFRFGPRWAQYKDLIIENLKSIDADVLAVALVDQNSERYNNTDVVTQLVNAMGYEYSYFAPVWAADDDGDLTTGEGTIGHLILSRYPILESETTILVEGNTNGWANPEGRGVGRVLLDVKGTKLDVYVTHFQDSSNWALFAENFAPKGDAFLILGNTKVAGDKDVISGILGKEDIKSAFTTDVNITGGTGVSFADSGRDTVLYETIIHESGESLVDPLYYTTVSIPGTASAPVEPTQLKTAVIPAFRFGPRWAQYKDLIIENLKSIDADVLAVALVDQNSERYNNTDVVTQLIDALGYEYSFFAPVWAADDDGDLTTGEGTIGHLILSRYPILESETTILVEGNTNGWANPEGRGVGRVLLDVKGTKLDVYVTHFQDSSNWALFAENFAPKGDAFLILGNTKVGGDKDVISGILGKEDIKSAFTTDVNITGGTGVSFANSGRDTVLYETIIHESGENLVDPLYYTTVTIA